MKRALSFGTLVVALGFAVGAHADAVTDWNLIGTNAITGPDSVGPLGPRVLGHMHGAMFDAVNAVDRRYTPFRVDLTAPGASAEAAAMTAAHAALVKIFPAQRVAFDTALEKSLASVPDGKAKEDGVALGRTVVEKSGDSILYEDVNARDPAFKLTAEPWSWRPDEGLFARGQTWHKRKPFLLKSADQFPLPGPLAVNSPEYAKEIDEVRVMGSGTSRERSSQQTAIAIFWTIGPHALFNDIARKESAAKRLDLAANARLFALLNMAMSDASVAVWHEKWRHNTLRPVAAIRDPSKLNNPALVQDANWTPLIVTPQHPDYPSGHAGVSGAAVTLLSRFFESDVIESKPSYVYPFGAVARRWTNYSELLKENGNGRVWGGIHTRTACEHGNLLGQQVGEYAFANFLRPTKG